MSNQRSYRLGAWALGLLLLGFAPAAGQEGEALDARWLPWMGCWEALSEEGKADLLCARPAPQAGAMEFLRVSDGAVVAREVLWADGAKHETTRESCTGWERGTFSQDGRRIFLTSEYACGDGVTQEGSGILAISSPSTFMDVRVAGMGGDRVAWVQRYLAASAEVAERAGFGDILEDRAWSVGQARRVAAAPLGVDDIVEASGAVPGEAVQALLVAGSDVQALRADQVVQLADAGVPDDVIDVAIATAYPTSFRTSPDGGASASALDEGSLRRRWGTSSAWGDLRYDPWRRYGYFGYGSNYYYGYGYGYGYDRLRYGGYFDPYGRYGSGGYYGYGYRPVIVEVDRNSSSASHGRVVAGKGYSSGRGSSAGPSPAYYPAGRSGASGTSSAGSSSGSSGSSGSSSGRTAKPRGGGDF